MKIDDKALAALAQPDTQTITVEMTEERKQKYSKIAGEVIDLLRERCADPLEAYAILHFVQHSLEENFGIRGGFSLGEAKQ